MFLRDDSPRLESSYQLLDRMLLDKIDNDVELLLKSGYDGSNIRKPNDEMNRLLRMHSAQKKEKSLKKGRY